MTDHTTSPASRDQRFIGIVEAMKDCCDKILAGNDPGCMWTTTLQAHGYVLSNDFTPFGTERPMPAETEA